MNMKVFILLAITLVLLTACSNKKKSDLEVYHVEASTYNLGSSYEVEATARVKGFVQKEKNNLYNASLFYEIDVVTPEGDTVKSLITKFMDESRKEKFSDVDLSVQFDLNSTYSKGNYQLIFRVHDANSGQFAGTVTKFQIKD